MTTSFKFELRPGSVVTGKWRQGRYRVERLLGEGANGKVYLVQNEREWLAMKIGVDAVDLQSEINVLKSMAKQQAQSAGRERFLYDVDDLLGPDGKEYPFYTMRYIRGTTLTGYLQEHGLEWFPLVGLNLLGKLSKLHAAGWVFGDLKMENVLVADYGHVELVDFGGATSIGKSIRQFTEIYDRGYWNSGSRSADPRYDLFSFGVLCIQIHEPKRLHQLTKELIPQNPRLPAMDMATGRAHSSSSLRAGHNNVAGTPALIRRKGQDDDPRAPTMAGSSSVKGHLVSGHWSRRSTGPGTPDGIRHRPRRMARAPDKRRHRQFQTYCQHAMSPAVDRVVHASVQEKYHP